MYIDINSPLFISVKALRSIFSVVIFCLAYLEVEVESHVIVPDLDDLVSGSDKMAAIFADVESRDPTTVNIGNLQGILWEGNSALYKSGRFSNISLYK